jgi:Arc/MetJ family transcription regulator
MRSPTKTTRSFSLDRDRVAEVKRTRGSLSESERVNRLLRTALEREKRAELEREIAGFFTAKPDDRKERRAFESVDLAAWAKE